METAEAVEDSIVRIAMEQFGHWWQRACRMQGHVAAEEIAREAFETGAHVGATLAMRAAQAAVAKIRETADPAQ